MRLFAFALPALLWTLPAAAQSVPTPQAASQSEPRPSALASPAIAPAVREVLGLDPLLTQLAALQASGQTISLDALNLRQQILERVLSASFDVDSALGRIDTEASYASEDRYVLEQRTQRQATALNLITFAASGALGAAGSAMQLTHGLNHAGTALQAAAGGTSLVLSGVQLKAGGGKQAIRSPYNMLAEILDQPANAESHYPPLVLAYLHAPRPGGQTSIAEGITSAWRRLHRLKEGPKGDGAPVQDLTADRASDAKLSADELADREAMLHDLHANLVLLRSQLQQVLADVQRSHAL